MTIKKELEGRKLTVSVEGRIDTTTVNEAEAQIKDGLENVTDLIIDFEKLDYISSAGLRLLLSLQKTMNTQGSMVVRNVDETVSEIFEVTGFSDILTIE